MKIVICGSIAFTDEMKKIADQLIKLGHEPELPLTSQRILRGEITMEGFMKEQAEGKGPERKIRDGVIKKYYDVIKSSDAILVLNMERKGIPNYVGGNTFLEMGFAHVLGKKIYLYNAVPHMIYTDEMVAMQPIVLNGDVSRIK